MIPKQPAGRSEAYLEYIRLQPCYICQDRPTEPHHNGKSGTGLKSSDFTAIPLCRKHHREWQDTGVKTFEKKHNCSISEGVVKHLVKWCDEYHADNKGG